MKLTVFNGSPRGRGSNTQALMSRLVEGFLEVQGNEAEVVCLRDEKDMTRPVQAFTQCDAAVLAFPLYTDSVPAVVKEFIEALQPLCAAPGNPALGFVVISGFPEAVHAQAVTRYLQKLAARLGCRYLGTITKGNAEGIRWGSEKDNKLIFAAFRRFGRDVAAGNLFDVETAAKLAGSARFSKSTMFMFKLVVKLGLTDAGWNRTLKANKAFEKRYDRPYE